MQQGLFFTHLKVAQNISVFVHMWPVIHFLATFDILFYSINAMYIMEVEKVDLGLSFISVCVKKKKNSIPLDISTA